MQIPEEAVRIFRGKNLSYLATTNADGSPHVAPTWVDVDVERNLVLINTAEGRRKVRNIRRDPRVAIALHEAEHPWPPLIVRGTAAITYEGGLEHIDFLSRKYDDEPWEPRPGQVRLILEIRPDSVTFPET